MTLEKGKTARGRAWGMFTAITLAALAGCAVETPKAGEPTVSNVPNAPPPEQSLATSNPAGSGETASATIDNAEGGVVELTDGSQLVVPPGALPPGVDTITVTSSTTPAPADYKTVSPVYDFGPDGAVFLKPLTVKIPFEVAAGASTDDLTVLWSRQRHDGYDMVPTTFEPAGESGKYFAVAEITHFSTGMVGKKYAVDPRPAPDPYGD